ncbi:hypothetical protein QBC47DRAFT_445787 [Echria macrotheca]|uniref:Uncharacterized protein n=1 Tax=Echria macrotheca TaxID=438768 RepID=A0AAJ0BCN5_9PEZI|nr:hypothetical protein QBC47DRAFT_445787 [Echria macrotheca]
MTKPAIVKWATAALFVALIQTVKSDRIGSPLNRTQCLADFTHANGSLTLNDGSVVSVNLSRPAVSVPVCEELCGSGHEVKPDCVNRVKEWMWPVLILIVAMEAAAIYNAGVSAFGLYFLALGDPLGMFQAVLARMRHEKLCRREAEDIWREVRRERPDTAVPAATRPSLIQQAITIELLPVPAVADAGDKTVKLAGPSVTTTSVPEESQTVAPHEKQKPPGSLLKSYAIVLSAMAELLDDHDAAKSAFNYALSRSSRSVTSKDAQDEAIIVASEFLHPLRSRGVPAAWIAVIACTLDLAFLVYKPLQDASANQPSGAKIASGFAFSWLLPLVLLHSYNGVRGERRKVAEEIARLLEALGEKSVLRNEAMPPVPVKNDKSTQTII